MIEFSSSISRSLNISFNQVKAVLQLIAEGATTPFIARYRKDKTGNLDEVQIEAIRSEAKQQKEFAERKAFILQVIGEAGKLSDTLLQQINNATTITQLEDLYLPYKVKRKTRATLAKELGLEPLARFLMKQTPSSVAQEARKYLNSKVLTPEDALTGARDIIAEEINENLVVRQSIRSLFQRDASIESSMVKNMEVDGAKFKDYFKFSEPVNRIPSHRILAILRGVQEGVLRVSIEPTEEKAHFIMERELIFGNNETSQQVKKAVKESYKRLLQPSLETEFRTELKVKADEEAINVFAENLRQLLLSAPLGNKRVLAIDPGYRSGCKLVCIDEQGNLLKTELIFIHENNFKLQEAEHKVRSLLHEFNIKAFAIGDGTAGRETQEFINKLKLDIPVYMVNEDGASIYSASEIGREEFPTQDITVRGAISIGRRLMDPLAELVKLDPKSIGVGQYQHDVSQSRLKEKLDQTVISCVNKVGVNLNTASKELLSYVSGIGKVAAENIIEYKRENGPFTSRKELLKVPRLGPKVYEQCAGFLRVAESKNPLDQSAVHPESYALVEKISKDLDVSVKSLIQNEKLIETIQPEKYITDAVGILSIKDILVELRKPGLDPRARVQTFEFAKIYKMEDLHLGMIVPGIVTNITRFGAFVDIGIKQDGMVHISEIANKYITDTNSVLKLNQQVRVKVLEIDVARKRISLSIKQALPL